MGLSLFKTGRYDEARAAYRRALANMRRQSPPVPARIYLAASGLGRTEVAAGRFAEAIEPLERALEIGHDNAGVHAHAEFALARALFETGGDRSRVERLASQAHRGYVEAGEPGRVYALEVEAWGRERGIDLRQRASP